MTWTPGDVSGSQTLVDGDHLYPSHINELREAIDSDYGRSFDAIVGLTSDYEYQSIQDAIDAIYTAGGGTIFVTAGTYDLAATITIKENVELIFSKGATLLRNASFVGASSYGVLMESHSIIRGGTIDGNDLTPSSIYHTEGIRISSYSHDIIIDSVVVDSWCHDSGIHPRGGDVSGEECYDIKIINCTVKNNTYAHGFQLQNCYDVQLINCRAENNAQDGFRAYDGKFSAIGCIARECRVGFQSWQTGNRRCIFSGCKAISCTNYGFLAQGLQTCISGCIAVGCQRHGFYFQGSQSIGAGLICSGNGLAGSPYDSEILIEGTNCTVSYAGITELAYGVKVTGDSNVITGTISGVGTSQVSDSGSGNQKLTP